MSRSQTGVLLGVLAALLWSPHFHTVMGSLGRDTSVLVFHFYVVFWAAVACLLALVVTGQTGALSVFRRQETPVLLLALTGGYGLWLMRALAIERGAGNPTHVDLLFYSAPLILGFLSIPQRDGARAKQIVALALGLVGCIMIASRPPTPAEAAGAGARSGGTLAALLAAGCWAVFALAARPLVRREKVLPIGAVLWSVGAACLLVTCLATGDSILAISRKGILTSLLLGAGTVALGFGCWLKCLAHLPPALAAPLWYLAVAFGVLWGYEPVTWWTAGGAALIVVAVYFASSGRERIEMTMSDLIRG